MRWRDRIGSRIASVGAIAAAALVGGTLAYGGLPGPDGVIHACVTNGLGGGGLRAVESTADCKRNETPLEWNQEGPQGEPGPAAANLWVVVKSDHSGIARSSGAVEFEEGILDNGVVDLIFDRDISGCAYIGAVADDEPDQFPAPGGFVFAEQHTELPPTTLRVATARGPNGPPSELPFHLAVFC